jgi:hypothetical protein
LNGKAGLFVTGDQELLHLKKMGDMQIISPWGFLGEIKVPILSGYSIIYDLLSVFPMAHIAMS